MPPLSSPPLQARHDSAADMVYLLQTNFYGRVSHPANLQHRIVASNLGAFLWGTKHFCILLMKNMKISHSNLLSNSRSI